MADDEKKPGDETNNTLHPRVSGFTNMIEVQFQEGTRVEMDSASEAACAFRSMEDAFSVDDLNAFLIEEGCTNAERVFDDDEDIAETEHLALMDGVDAPDLSGLWVLYFPQNRNVHTIARRLRSYPRIKYAAALPLTRFASAQEPQLPKDELLFEVRGKERDHQWYIERCNVDKAWKLGYTGNGVVIADLDSGFQTDHPDLIGRFNSKFSFNTATGNNILSKTGGNLSHGTAVAGLAGAAADDKGMVGVAHGAELWLIEVGPPLIFDPYPQLNPLAWVKAIRQVIKFIRIDSRRQRVVILIEGQTVTNGNITQILMIREAILSAIAHGAIVCVAAGNGNRDVSEADCDDSFGPCHGEIFKPAGINVGATDFNDEPFKVDDTGAGTNFGEAVAVTAPGDPLRDLTCSDDLNSPFPYTSLFGGTSGAAAKVAGAIALMLQANSELKHAEVEQIFRNTGKPITSKPLGRLLNCEEAVLMAKELSRQAEERAMAAD